ncbi:hypothetical protein EGH24_03160 [Halonotius terrestris]|uniref:Uncharacterized protein n=1 Tax=Halonotius terrestris TaxID=2487750 RepID=A0A8J8PCD6_9EURY|nr:hypothetical protein [Halonotius terrestris]TQQ83794.1 hypothetical protein EGH24_03160 [Halonotius terrestris]
MFTERTLSPPVAAARGRYAPAATVLDVDTDFETLPPAVAEDLGLLADSIDPASYPAEWVPETAPTVLQKYAGSPFTIGMPGDGTVVWTTQTEPPTVLLKQRAEGTPDPFLDFLIAEAFVKIDCSVPEHFLPFFADAYADLDAAVGLGGADVYQIAAALFDGWVGLQTRPVFASWADESEFESLHEAWVDAGQRLEGRLGDLSRAVAHDEMTFAEATEYACAAIKHDLEIPTPFSALDTGAYRDHGADYGVEWAEKTFAELQE